MAADRILEVTGVVKHFDGIKAVAGATLDVEDHSITALIGPNGAGKTTLFNLVTGFYRPEAGAIALRGQRIDGKPPHAVARLGLARTFQLTKALARMSVIQNVMLAAQQQPGEHLWQVYLRRPRVRRREREIEARAHELLGLVDLDRMAEDYAGTLSGGQRKLLEFARALMTDPSLVLLDEPMAGVNPTLGLQLLRRMQQLRAEEGTTFLLIEHDMEVVMTVSDRVIVMNEGRVVADGPPGAIRQDQQVIDAYLGEQRSPPRRRRPSHETDRPGTDPSDGPTSGGG